MNTQQLTLFTASEQSSFSTPEAHAILDYRSRHLHDAMHYLVEYLDKIGLDGSAICVFADITILAGMEICGYPNMDGNYHALLEELFNLDVPVRVKVKIARIVDSILIPHIEESDTWDVLRCKRTITA